MAAAVVVAADWRPAAETLRRLADAGTDLGAPGGVLDQIGQTLATSTQHRFETGRGPDGTPWKPSRRALEQGGQTLVHRGFLKDIRHRVGADHVDVGTHQIYGAIHQFGSGSLPRPKGIPARPYLGLDEDDRDAVLDIVRDALERAT